MRHARRWSVGALALFLTVGCSDQTTAPSSDFDGGLTLAKRGNFLDEANEALAAQGANFRVYKAEFLGTGVDRNTMGQTLFAFDVGNKHLAQQWVPGDPRREDRTDIAWATDLTEGATSSGLTSPETTAAIANAMDTWASQTCSDGLTLPNIGDYGVDKGIIQFLVGFGGDISDLLAPTLPWDILHAGWLPGAFFDAIAPPNGSQFILAVTFSFWFVDGGGNPTDIDGDGYLDKAIAEIYYNDAWNAPGWEIDMPNDPGPDFDVETVALHEAGHGLAQAHFGQIFLTNANGKVHFSPLAVMNAAYSGVRQGLLGSDLGGHCSMWAQWPNN